MEMWLGMKRAINAAEHVQKKYEEGRAKIAEVGKRLQDADRHAEENAAKITELSSRLAEAKRVAVDAEGVRARAETAKEAKLRSRATELEEAKKQAIAEYRNSPEFVVLLDNEVMEQCEDLIYRFKRFNADKKIELELRPGSTAVAREGNQGDGRGVPRGGCRSRFLERLRIGQ
ncbi:unnamed protein product [Prunus armeniaca]